MAGLPVEPVEPADYAATHEVFRTHFMAATPAEAPQWLRDHLTNAARSHAGIDQSIVALKNLQQAGAMQLSVVEGDLKTHMGRVKLEQDQAIAELRTEVQDLKNEVWEYRRGAQEGSRSN